MVSLSGMILKCWDAGTQCLPPGGRGTAKRWMRNGEISFFGMHLNQTIQIFQLYFLTELQTNSEHIAVPHPPQCALLKHLPPGGRYGAAHPYKFQFIGLLRKPIIPIFKFIPGGDTASYISYLLSYIFLHAPSAAGPTWRNRDREEERNVWILLNGLGWTGGRFGPSTSPGR